MAPVLERVQRHRSRAQLNGTPWEGLVIAARDLEMRDLPRLSVDDERLATAHAVYARARLEQLRALEALSSEQRSIARPWDAPSMQHLAGLEAAERKAAKKLASVTNDVREARREAAIQRTASIKATYVDAVTTHVAPAMLSLLAAANDLTPLHRAETIRILRDVLRQLEISEQHGAPDIEPGLEEHIARATAGLVGTLGRFCAAHCGGLKWQSWTLRTDRLIVLQLLAAADIFGGKVA